MVSQRDTSIANYADQAIKALDRLIRRFMREHTEDMIEHANEVMHVRTNLYAYLSRVITHEHVLTPQTPQTPQIPQRDPAIQAAKAYRDSLPKAERAEFDAGVDAIIERAEAEMKEQQSRTPNRTPDHKPNNR